MQPLVFARTAGRLAATLIWPARCAACNALVPEDRAFCVACAVSVLSPEPACPRCAGPADAWCPAPLPAAADLGQRDGARRGARPRPSAVCRACRAAPPPYAATSAAALYGGALIAPLLAFKHGDKRHLARPLARLLGPALRASLQAGVAAVLPVPLHARRLRARGFNQALDLLRAGLGLLASEPPPGRAGAQGHGPSSPPPEILVDALVRLRDTPPLGHLSPVERRCEVSAAFAASRPAVVRGRHLLLVDDVMTTGATVAACAAALLDAGAASVRVAVLARAWPGAA